MLTMTDCLSVSHPTIFLRVADCTCCSCWQLSVDLFCSVLTCHRKKKITGVTNTIISSSGVFKRLVRLGPCEQWASMSSNWNWAFINWHLCFSCCNQWKRAPQRRPALCARIVKLHITFSQTAAFSLKMRPLHRRQPHKSSLVLFLSLVLCNLVCFRWCAGDDSCSSSGAWAKESSKRWAQLDAEVATGGRKVSLPRWVVCTRLSWEEGIRTRGMQSEGAVTAGDSFVFLFLFCF